MVAIQLTLIQPALETWKEVKHQTSLHLSFVRQLTSGEKVLTPRSYSFLK